MLFEAIGARRFVPNPEDFRAFYCAGEAVARHRDPYLAEPLRACEARETLAAGLYPVPGLVVPAPLPGYSLALFAALSRLPLAGASNLFTLALVVSVALAAILTSRLGRVPILAALAALALSDCSVQVQNGQIAGFAIAGICAAGWALARGKPREAAAYAGLVAIEPHVALPLILSIALFVPRARAALAVVLAGLAAISLLTLSLAQNVEYVARVLPAQARAEIFQYIQLSLTSVLARLGVPAAAALPAGTLSYVAMTLAGLYVARRIALRFAAPEAYALVPPAFSVLGGSYMHLGQVAAAIPAGFLLARLVPERRRSIALGVVLLSVPWRYIADNDALAAIASVAVVTALLATLLFRNETWRIAAVSSSMVALAASEVAVAALTPASGLHTLAPIAAVAGGDLLAQATWQAFSAVSPDSIVRYWVTGLPTWLGLGLLVARATLAATRSRSPVVESLTVP